MTRKYRVLPALLSTEGRALRVIVVDGADAGIVSQGREDASRHLLLL